MVISQPLDYNPFGSFHRVHLFNSMFYVRHGKKVVCATIPMKQNISNHKCIVILHSRIRYYLPWLKLLAIIIRLVHFVAALYW